MIVVDERTDEEKLRELLAAGAEETAFDFKATLDLSGKASKDSVEFAKDAISMGNLPTGGYIVIGVDDQGNPAHAQAPVDPTQFDSANLRSKVARYVDAPVHLISQAHDVDGRIVVVVFIAPNPDGLPVPVSRDGQYDRNGRSVTVFNEGEVLIREGTSNIRLRYSHWHGLLERYRETARAEARRDSDELIRRVVESMRAASSPTPLVPLDAAMDDETLTQSLLAIFESGSSVRIQQFLNDAKLRAGSGVPSERDRRLDALDQIALVACQAIVYRESDVFRLAIDSLERAYAARLLSATSASSTGSDTDRAQHYLDVLVRVLAIGALAVRTAAWDLLPSLSNRPVVEQGYEWASWLRHAITMAARANLLRDANGQARGGQALSLARTLIVAKAALRPDFGPTVDIPAASSLAHDDWVLNSLCEFDLWWCILALANRPDTRESAAYFPSCSAFHQWRSQPTLDRIATDPAVRTAAFGDASNDLIADAMLAVVKMAVSQSHQYGGWWSGFDQTPEVAQYVNSFAKGNLS